MRYVATTSHGPLRHPRWLFAVVLLVIACAGPGFARAQSSTASASLGHDALEPSPQMLARLSSLAIPKQDAGGDGATAIPRTPDAGMSSRQPAGSRRARAWSLGGLVGVYAAFSTWAYFAWYHNTPLRDFRINGDGWFGRDTYAGGADKMGHLWTNHVLTGLGTEILDAGGWGRRQGAWISAGLATAMFTMVEVKDGYYYEFSVGDWVGNVVGAGLSVAMAYWPALDDWIDLRLQYWPSADYRREIRNGDIDFAEDYSGQTYLLALHLKAVPGLTSNRWSRWLRYVDVVAGFKTRNYKPDPVDAEAIPTQSLFLGLSFNLQHAVEVLAGPGRPGWQKAGKIGFEYISPPFSTLEVIGSERGFIQSQARR